MNSETPREPHFAQQDLDSRCEELFRLSSDREPNLREIARCTSKIPGLAALVVQRANSARLGLRHRVHDVDHAVVLLGADQIHGLVRQLMLDNERLRTLAEQVSRGVATPPPSLPEAKKESQET